MKHHHKSQVVLPTVQRISLFGKRKWVYHEKSASDEYLLGTYHGFDTLLIVWGTTWNKTQSCHLESYSTERESPGEGSRSRCYALINSKVWHRSYSLRTQREGAEAPMNRSRTYTRFVFLYKKNLFY